jgi:nucleoside-diphosphate-sugar epimerase
VLGVRFSTLERASLHSVNDLANGVLDLAGAGVGIRYELARLGEIRESYADISKAKQLLKFGPKVALRGVLLL